MWKWVQPTKVGVRIIIILAMGITACKRVGRGLVDFANYTIAYNNMYVRSERERRFPALLLIFLRTCRLNVSVSIYLLLFHIFVFLIRAFRIQKTSFVRPMRGNLLLFVSARGYYTQTHMHARTHTSARGGEIIPPFLSYSAIVIVNILLSVLSRPRVKKKEQKLKVSTYNTCVHLFCVKYCFGDVHAAHHP